MNKAEFKQIFDAHFDAIRSYIYYRCSDEQVASDIAQDIFIKVWEKRDQLSVGSIKPLLYKIARDMTADYYRKQQVRLNFASAMATVVEAVSPQDSLQFEELRERYSVALARLPDDQRETFLMSRNDELKYSEIAERLGISVKAVEKRISTVLRFLKERLL